MYINLYISTKDAVVATRNSYGEVRHRAATAKALSVMSWLAAVSRILSMSASREMAAALPARMPG